MYNTTVGEAKKLGDRLKRATNPSSRNVQAKAASADQSKPGAQSLFIIRDNTDDVELDLAYCIKHLGTLVTHAGGKQKYERHPECLLAVKSLIKQVGNETSEKMIMRRYLTRSGVVNCDLIPLLLANLEDAELWIFAIWLLMELTLSPVQVSLRIPRDRLEDNPNVKAYMRELGDRRQYCKKAFISVEFFNGLRDHVSGVLRKPVEDRAKMELPFPKRALCMVANILEMHGSSQSAAGESPATLQLRLFRAISDSGFNGVVIYAARAEKDLHLDVVEILYNLLRDNDPENVGKAVVCEKSLEADDKLMHSVRSKTLSDKRLDPLKAISRHSTFGGTFVMKGSKAVDPTNEMVLVKPLKTIMDNKFELTASKAAQAKPRHRKALKTTEESRVANAVNSPELRLFCSLFLDKAYNSFMKRLKAEVIKAASGADPDQYITRYFWALRFFMAFNRVNDFRVELVSETITVDSFHFILTKLDNFMDMLKMQKDEILKWSERIHWALRGYQELLWTLTAMLSHADETVQRAAKQLETSIFYTEEYREVFLTLLREFTETKFTRTYLKDLVMSIHIYVKLLETCLKEQDHLYVLKKQKKRNAGKKRPTKSGRKKKASKLSQEERLKIWDAGLEKLQEALEKMDSADDHEYLPYDPMSLEPLDNQTDIARSRIQNALLDKDHARVVGLLKGSKIMWNPLPDDPAFGVIGDAIDLDLTLLKKIIQLELPDLEPEVTPDVASDVFDDDVEVLQQKIGLDDSDDEIRGKPRAGPREVEFALESYIKRFATPSHLEPYLLLLKNCTSNSFLVNHAVLKMLHRVAWDLKLPGMLFQMSLFRLYYHLQNKNGEGCEPAFWMEFQDFMRYLLTTFFEKLRSDPKTILYVLFWKSRGEANSLFEEADDKPTRSKEKGQAITTFVVENGNVSIVQQRREETPSDDEVDFMAKLNEIKAGPDGANGNVVRPKKNAKPGQKASKKNGKRAKESDDDAPGPSKKLGKTVDHERGSDAENEEDGMDSRESPEVEDIATKLRRFMDERKAKEAKRATQTGDGSQVGSQDDAGSSSQLPSARPRSLEDSDDDIISSQQKKPQRKLALSDSDDEMITAVQDMPVEFDLDAEAAGGSEEHRRSESLEIAISSFSETRDMLDMVVEESEAGVKSSTVPVRPDVDTESDEDVPKLSIDEDVQ